MEFAELEAIRRDLAALVGATHVSVRPSDRALYSRDCWPRALLWERRGELRHQPDVVAWPGSTDDVVRVLRYARERQLPVVPFGAGSGVVAGTVPLRAGIVLDLKRMRRLSATSLEERRATAQAGIVGQRLEDALNRRGATMGHFPSSMYCSTLGGWIAARGAGQLSSYYGKIEDMVLGLVAVTGTAQVLRCGPERAPGPDLVQLLTGSEGTLAVVTEATFRIHPRPTARALRGVRMRSVEAGVETMRLIFRAGLRPHVLRLYDPLDTFAVEMHGGSRRTSAQKPMRHSKAGGLLLGVPRLLNTAVELLPPRSLLVLAFEGEVQARVEAELRAALDVAREHGGTDVGEAPARRWYRTRYGVAYKQSPVFMSNGWTDTMEVACTWDKTLHVYERVRAATGREAFVMCHFSHAYLEGTSLYFTFVGPARTPEEGEASYERVWKSAMQASLAAGATLSHHHGVGAHKARMLPEELGDGGMRLLRGLKQAFDPDGILNPGKLLA